MFPILKRQSERLALGYVASRIVEGTMIGVGLIALLSILTLSDDLAASIGGDSGSLVIAGRTLVAIHDWTFVMGPGFCVGVNDLLLGYLMYTTGLMPPRLAMVGIVGGPLIFASKILVVFGVFDIYSSGAGIFAIPVFIFEASFAIYLIVKGFRPSHVLSGEPATAKAREAGGIARPVSRCLPPHRSGGPSQHQFAHRDKTGGVAAAHSHGDLLRSHGDVPGGVDAGDARVHLTVDSDQAVLGQLSPRSWAS